MGSGFRYRLRGSAVGCASILSTWPNLPNSLRGAYHSRYPALPQRAISATLVNRLDRYLDNCTVSYSFRRSITTVCGRRHGYYPYLPLCASTYLPPTAADQVAGFCPRNRYKRFLDRLALTLPRISLVGSTGSSRGRARWCALGNHLSAHPDLHWHSYDALSPVGYRHHHQPYTGLRFAHGYSCSTLCRAGAWPAIPL